MSKWRELGAATAAAALLGACTSGAVDPGAEDPGPEDGGGAAGEATAEAEPEVVEPHGRMRLTGFREDQRAGRSVALLAVEVDEDGHLHVEFEAVNSGGRQMRLNGLTTMVEDDHGNAYAFREPTDGSDLQLRPDERMTGTLVFRGPVDPEARRFTLAFNQVGQRSATEVVGAEDSPQTDQYPPFAFREVPLPGVGLEDEASTGDGAPLLASQTVEVDQTASPEGHPDVEVTLVEYETDGRTLRLQVEAVNRSSQRVTLLHDQPVLVDDVGSRFTFLRAGEDEAERRLILEPGTEASATLGYRATLRPEATELRLTFNSFAFVVDSQQRNAPGLRFTLPMPPADGTEDS